MDTTINTENTFVGGKEAHRRRLVDLPYPEKVRIVIELQRIAAPILKARGVMVSPWRLDEETDAHRALSLTRTGK